MIVIKTTARIEAQNDVSFDQGPVPERDNNEVAAWFTETQPVDILENRAVYILFREILKTSVPLSAARTNINTIRAHNCYEFRRAVLSSLK